MLGFVADYAENMRFAAASCRRVVHKQSDMHVIYSPVYRKTWLHTYVIYLSAIQVFTTRHCASMVHAIVMCLSVTSQCPIQTAKCMIVQTVPHELPRDCSFLMPKILAKLKWDYPQRRCQMQVGYWVRLKLATI